MTRLLHLLTPDAAAALGAVRGPSPGEAFVHLCTLEQVDGVRARFFGDGPLVVLVLDEQALRGEVRFEDSYGHGLFPHLYGEIATEAALAWVVVEPGEPAATKLARFFSRG